MSINNARWYLLWEEMLVVTHPYLFSANNNMPYCNKSDSLKQYRAFWLYVNITQDVTKLFAPTEKIVAKHVRKPLELFSPLHTQYTLILWKLWEVLQLKNSV